MEYFPPEILDHIFNQFPNKCKLCQKECLLASAWKELTKCSKTCERWKKIIENKINKLTKCCSECIYLCGTNIISVTLKFEKNENFGVEIGRPMNPNALPEITPSGSFPYIGVIRKKGPVGRNSKIRSLDWILQVNEICLNEIIEWSDILNVLKDALKHQYVRMVVGQVDTYPQILPLDHVDLRYTSVWSNQTPLFTPEEQDMFYPEKFEEARKISKSDFDSSRKSI